MTQKNTIKDLEWENVKMRRWLVDELRTYKSKKDTPILKFVERAVIEKLEREKNKSK